MGGGVGVRRWRGKGRGGGEEGEKWRVEREIDRQGGEGVRETQRKTERN